MPDTTIATNLSPAAAQVFDLARIMKYVAKPCGDIPRSFDKLPEPSDALKNERGDQFTKLQAVAPKIAQAVSDYVEFVQMLQYEEAADRHAFATHANWVTLRVGPVYACVVKIDRDTSTGNVHEFGSRSAHTFIRLADAVKGGGLAGDILKAANLKAPAPNGVRGSVLLAPAQLRKLVNGYGAIYLR